MDPKLTEFVAKKRDEGLSDKEIEIKLKSVGWDDTDIESALAHDEDIPLPPKSKMSPSVGHVSSDINMWVSFQHVLMFIALYVMSVSLMLAIGTLINRNFPEFGTGRAGSSYRSNYYDQELRWYLSALIVSFPLFASLFIITGKRIIKNPAERFLEARKKSIYMTLIGAFIILIWTLIRTVYTFLDGNITVNFVLHLLNKLIIFGSMFTYFIYDVKRSSQE